MKKVLILALALLFGQIQASELVSKLSEYKRGIALTAGAVAGGYAVYKVYQKFCELNKQVELLQASVTQFERHSGVLAQGHRDVDRDCDLVIKGIHSLLVKNNQLSEKLEQLEKTLSEQSEINKLLSAGNGQISIKNDQLNELRIKLLKEKMVLSWQKAVLISKTAKLSQNNVFAQVQYANSMHQLTQENNVLKEQLRQLQEQQAESDSSEDHPEDQEESKQQIHSPSQEQHVFADANSLNGISQEDLERLSQATSNEDIAKYEFKDVQEFTEAIQVILNKENKIKYNLVLLKYDDWIDEILQIKALIESKIQLADDQQGLWDMQLQKIESIEQELNKSPWKSGEQVMQALMADKNGYINNIKNDENAHLKAIVDLVWYFYYLAVKKEQYFTEGAFGLVWNKDAVYDLLLAHDKIYSRNGNGSSHFKEQDDVIQYGLDVHAENLCLPNDMTHILFGDINKRGYLFIKTEPHGIGNFQDTVGHTFGYLGSVYKKLSGCNSKDCCRKEHLPDSIKKLWLEFIKAYSINPVNSEQSASTSSSFSVVSSLSSTAIGLGSIVSSAVGFTHVISDICNSGLKYGISQMILNLRNKIFQTETPAQALARAALLAEIYKYDNLEYRKGNEVILTQTDFGF